MPTLTKPQAPAKKQGRKKAAPKRKAAAKRSAQKNEGLTKAAYRRLAFFDALMQDADFEVAKSKTKLIRLGKYGNTKIGKEGEKGLSLVYSGLAWHDCPGKTEACTRICYAENFRYLINIQKRNGTAFLYSFMARNRIQVLEDIIALEISRAILLARFRGVPVVVRIHEAGDFISAEHVQMWQRLAERFPEVIFWFFTRSHQGGPDLAAALDKFTRLPNVYGRRSFDPEEHPEDLGVGTNFPAAVVFGSLRKGVFKGPKIVKNTVNCLEQLTKNTLKLKCMNCGFCFDPAMLAIRFRLH